MGNQDYAQELLDDVINNYNEIHEDKKITKERAETIYVQMKYGGKTCREIAHYYNVEPDLIHHIYRLINDNPKAF